MPEDFAGARAREIAAKFEEAGNFVGRELRAGEAAQVFNRRRMRWIAGRDDRLEPEDGLTLADRHDHACGDGWELLQHCFHFKRIDFHPADVDEKLDPAGDEETAGRVEMAEIAGGE